MNMHATNVWLTDAAGLCTNGVTTMLGVSLRDRRDTTLVMLGVSLRARSDTTLVPINDDATTADHEVKYYSDQCYTIHSLSVASTTVGCKFSM